MARRLAVYVALALLAGHLATGTAAAQTVAPPTPPSPPPADMAGLPDVVGYVRFIVPQCDDCNGAEYNIGLEAKPAPEVTWTDPGSPIKWLAWAVEDIIRRLICWLLAMLQHAANFLSAATNAVLTAVNWFWRLLVFAWLTVRSWLYGLWYLVEVLRDWLQGAQAFMLLVEAWLWALWRVLVLALALAGELVLMLGYVVLAGLGLIGWIGGLILGLLLSITLQLQAPTVPAQLQDTHIVYQLTRGALEALHDSQLGWVLYLAYGLAYVAFVVWASRFFASSREA